MIFETLLPLFLTAGQLTFEPVHKNLTFKEPIQVLYDGVDGENMYVVEKDGVVYKVSNESSATEKAKVMDITDRVVVKNSEEGLLSLTFHPNFKDNNLLYVWYTANNPDSRKNNMLLSSFKVTEDGVVDKTSETIIMTVKQPWGNHNGGTVLFGPDGKLYLSIGDGGSGGDPHGNGQNKNTLLGTVIRIDVDHTSGGKAYSIPSDNPFVGEKNTREEIWAYGLRNVWRMSFDKETGKLWAGDVGQHDWEEIDIVESGGNYGWKIREGAHEFEGKSTVPPGLVDPVYEYGRREGGSITGGYVYRGSELKESVGLYFFNDYMSGRTWSLNINGDTASVKRIALDTPLAVSSFGETPMGELLVCGFKSAYGRKGKIYRLVSVEVDSSDKESNMR